MASNAIQDDDWDLISKAVKCKDERLDKEELTLQQMIDDNYLLYLNEIDEIVQRAQKKLSLREKLNQMKKELRDFKLELFPYKGNATYVLKGYDDIYTILDDHTVSTGGMLGS